MMTRPWVFRLAALLALATPITTGCSRDGTKAEPETDKTQSVASETKSTAPTPPETKHAAQSGTVETGSAVTPLDKEADKVHELEKELAKADDATERAKLKERVKQLQGRKRSKPGSPLTKCAKGDPLCGSD